MWDFSTSILSQNVKKLSGDSLGKSFFSVKNRKRDSLVVRAVENVSNYLYGTEFEVVSDQEALPTILKGNRVNKIFSSRLTRWADRLRLFHSTVNHEPGRTLALAYYYQCTHQRATTIIRKKYENYVTTGLR